MKKTPVVTLIILLALAGFAIYKSSKEEPIVFIDEVPANESRSELSSFDWQYEDFYSEDTDLPYTRVFLKATYKNGKTILEKIDEVQGSCNAVEPQANEDEDMASGTTKIQCYAAGFGSWFKITNKFGAYNVLKKDFEEASPDYDPPVMEYETIQDFPLVY